MFSRRGRKACRCASLPKLSIIQATMLWIEMKAAVDGQAAASSPKITAASQRVKPQPPEAARTELTASARPAAVRGVATGTESVPPARTSAAERHRETVRVDLSG